MKHWPDMDLEERIEVIKLHWEGSTSASSLAKIISKATDSTVSRATICGIYYRNREALEKHPLNGQTVRDGAGRDWAGRLSAVNPKKKKASKKVTEAKPVAAKPMPELARAPAIRITPEAQAFDALRPGVPLVDLQADECVWPINSPPKGQPYLFCGHQVESGRYCPHHHQRSLPPTLRAKKT